MTGNGASYEVQYYLRDHLGNVRMVMNEAGTIVQETEYFPFGLAIPKSGTDAVNKYQFLNREKQPETGWMDLMKRSYDPTISRFLQVDPVTESQEDYSVYQYGWNNPILRSDPNGDFPGILPLLPYLAAAAETATATLLEATVTAGAITVAKDLINKAGAGAGLYSPGVGMAMSTSKSGDLTGQNNNESNTNTSNSLGGSTVSGGNSSKGKNGGSFGAEKDTKGDGSSKSSLKNAKEQNSIPRSQQPDLTIKPNTPDGDKAGLDNRNVVQFEYTNSKGEKIIIRRDHPAAYGQGGQGDQGAHYNAGRPTDSKLKQHHYDK